MLPGEPGDYPTGGYPEALLVDLARVAAMMQIGGLSLQLSWGPEVNDFTV